MVRCQAMAWSYLSTRKEKEGLDTQARRREAQRAHVRHTFTLAPPPPPSPRALCALVNLFQDFHSTFPFLSHCQKSIYLEAFIPCTGVYARVIYFTHTKWNYSLLFLTVQREQVGAAARWASFLTYSSIGIFDSVYSFVYLIRDILSHTELPLNTVFIIFNSCCFLNII